MRKVLHRLGLLFAAIYFLQGLGSPTDGLLAQPVRSLLKNAGYDAAGIATLSGIAGLPWLFKPLFGLVSDAWPLFGSRRRSYLLTGALGATAAFAGLYWAALDGLTATVLIAMILIATFGVALADVIADALMVEHGQAASDTGRMQSIQWTAMYVAAILAGLGGGWLSQHGFEREGFLICAGLVGTVAVLAVLAVPEPRDLAPPVRLSTVLRELRHDSATPSLFAILAILCLWSFNPFNDSVLYVHLTTAMGFTEQFYGLTLSLMSVGGLLGAVAYWFYCRRVDLIRLAKASIWLGIAATLAYWLLVGERSAAGVSVFVGFAYVTALLIQLDLAARLCPGRWAGTVFATLMALSNISVSLAEVAGGWLYRGMADAWGAPLAFQLLVAAGATVNLPCLWFIPRLRRGLLRPNAPSTDG